MFDMIAGLVKIFWIYIKLIVIVLLVTALFGYYAYTQYRIRALEDDMAMLKINLNTCHTQRERYQRMSDYRQAECEQLLQYERDRIDLQIKEGEIGADRFEGIRQKEKGGK